MSGARGPRQPRVFEAGSSSDPFQLLAAEHALIRLHVARTLDLAGRRPDGADARQALEVLADSLRLHERREDLALYPLCEELFGGRGGVAAVLREDHDAIRQALRRLLAVSARLGPTSLDTLEELRRLLEDHFGKEERVLFPLMTAYLPGKESARLVRRLRTVSSA